MLARRRRRRVDTGDIAAHTLPASGPHFIALDAPPAAVGAALPRLGMRAAGRRGRRLRVGHPQWVTLEWWVVGGQNGARLRSEKRDTTRRPPPTRKSAASRSTRLPSIEHARRSVDPPATVSIVRVSSGFGMPRHISIQSRSTCIVYILQYTTVNSVYALLVTSILQSTRRPIRLQGPRLQLRPSSATTAHRPNRALHSPRQPVRWRHPVESLQTTRSGMSSVAFASVR